MGDGKRTPGEWMELLKDLYNGVPVVATCEACGHEHECGERHGLITREQFLDLLDAVPGDGKAGVR